MKGRGRGIHGNLDGNIHTKILGVVLMLKCQCCGQNCTLSYYLNLHKYVQLVLNGT